jgi:chemotaxis protein CheD
VSAVLASVAATAPVSPRWLTPTRLHMLPAIYVHPGQVCVNNDSSTLTTILGSCVAICLHDFKMRVGGLNHFLLPDAGAADAASGRYARGATAQLVTEMLARGASMDRLAAQIVGGASVLAAFSQKAEHLGYKNVTAARDVLAGYGIPVVGTDVGGVRGRKLIFSTRDGATLVQLIGA